MVKVSEAMIKGACLKNCGVLASCDFPHAPHALLFGFSTLKSPRRTSIQVGWK